GLDDGLQKVADAQRHREIGIDVAKAETAVQAAVRAAKSQFSALARLADSDSSTRFAVSQLRSMGDRLTANQPPPRDELANLSQELERRERAADEQLARSNEACRAAVQHVSGMSRLDLARAAARRLADQLEPQGGAQILSFQGNALTGAMSPQGNRPIGSLARALRQVSLGERRSDAVIFISDGRSSENHAVISSALAGTTTPIDTLSVTAGGPSSLLRVDRIDVPGSALLHETINVRVHLSHRGGGTRNVSVGISDGATTQQRTLRVPSGGSDVVFAWKVNSAPLLHLTCRASLADTGRSASGQTSADVRVADRKIHVLLLCGSDDADARALRESLSAAPWIDLTAPPVTSSIVFTAEQVERQDVIVCGDLPGNVLGIGAAQLLRRAVVERGKSLLLIPRQTREQASMYPWPLSSMLPFTAVGSRAPATQWRGPASTQSASAIAVPTYDARDAGLIDREQSYDAVVRQWLVRPLLGRPPDVGALREGARALVVDRDTQAPMVVDCAVGSGRVMTVTIHDVWRWGAEQSVFWQTLVHSLDEPPYAMESEGLMMDVDGSPLTAGVTRTIRVRTTKDGDQPVTLNVMRDGYIDQTLALREWPPGSRRFRATFASDTPGDVEIVCRQGLREISAPLTIVAPNPETEDTTPDPGLLRRVAEISGGEAFTLDRLPELPDDLSEQRATRVQTVITPIWCSGYALAFIIACLGCEWALRKYAGLI
ncbi:MAG: hypothetical protein ACTHM6_07180, partial [Tepidisphaeraceae bacterium]